MSINAGLPELELPIPRTGGYLPWAVEELLLLREMNHRFSNTLTLLVSQFRHDPESFVSTQFRELVNRTEARIDPGAQPGD
jgi:two-component sensor histidine kinase